MSDEPNQGPTMFTFYVRHEGTKHVAMFKGQGKTIEAASKDAIAALTTGFRPNSSGIANAHSAVIPSLSVRLPDGRTVNMKREDFEDGKPFTGQIEPNPEPKTSEQVARATAADSKRGEHR